MHPFRIDSIFLLTIQPKKGRFPKGESKVHAMSYEAYNRRTINKVKDAAGRYSRYIFKKVGVPENMMWLETKEHFRSVPTDGWKPLQGPFDWGEEWDNIWVRMTYTVPSELAGQDIYIEPHTGAVEALVFINGKPDSIINSKHDFIGGMHSAQMILKNAQAGERVEVALECYAGHFEAGTQPFDRYGQECEVYGNEFRRHFEGIDICLMDHEMRDFVFDLKTAVQLTECIPDTDFMNGKARNAVMRVFEVLGQYPARMTEEEIHSQITACREIMKPLLATRGTDGQRGRVGIIGHSHMDTAWLWPVNETIRKCARTYATVLKLMKEYPEYKFVQSSALHLDWMRRYYPDIFEGIRERVREGRYEPNGGVWVECDCNVTSGESMVRQFLKGQLFTRKYLNYTSDCFWLPDTFGYNMAIPQIMRESEVKYFYTTKIAWGDLNDFPYNTFNWRGLDGSTVITHFNRIHCMPDAETTQSMVNEIKEKQVFDGRLMSFGYGDGGGGPTWGMLEDARRVQGLAGLPEQYYTTVSDFMKTVEREAVGLPVYSGELYVETHRGTLTQMHDIKRNNRKAEFALRDMEYFNVLSSTAKNSRTDEMYETLLINQFHDILPGTCITPVNVKVREQMTALIDAAKKETAAYASGLTEGDGVTVFNTLSFARRGTVYLENLSGIPHGVLSQRFTDLCGRQMTAVSGLDIPAFGAVSLALDPDSAEKPGKSVFSYDGQVLDTPTLRVVFDENGFIASMTEKSSGREVRKAGGAPLNTFWFGEDIPREWDNWNIDDDLARKLHPAGELLSREVVTDGPIELRLRSVYRLTEKTTLKQDMIFHADSPQVDFHTVIDWNEKQKMLKVGFDVDIFSATVKNEIQFGHIERATMPNNSFEAAKFEVCNHKWSDLSESRFGVALLNDCKYGISVSDSDMRLSLHRGGTRPDVTGDRGVHEMTYSLLPHTGTMCAENVIHPAYELNVPCVTVPGTLKKPVAAPVTIGESNIICEAVKPAELTENAYVVRLYEAERCKTVCKIGVGADVRHVYVTNMLEDIRYELPVTDGQVTVPFKPFQIVTLLMQR